MKTFTVTRAPRYEGYDSLHGGEDFAPDDFVILVDGQSIGGTYWGNSEPGIYQSFYVGDGHWHSWGPAGLSMGHATRADAEQAQVREYAANPDLADRILAETSRREAQAETRGSLCLVDFLQVGCTYWITYQCRDIGYGPETGDGEFIYCGLFDGWGKHEFQPADGDGPALYLFPDEIRQVD
jgi:hypothetical protein